LVVVAGVETFRDRFCDRADHPLGLEIRSRVLQLCQPALGLLLAAHAVKDLVERTRIAASICEFDAAAIGLEPMAALWQFGQHHGVLGPALTAWGGIALP